MATQAFDLTLSDTPSETVVSSNRSNPGEYRNGENQDKMGMASRFRGVRPIPGANEKGRETNPSSPYQDPTQVPLGEKP